MFNVFYNVRLEAGVDIVTLGENKINAFEQYILLFTHGKNLILYKKINFDKTSTIKCFESSKAAGQILDDCIKEQVLTNVYIFKNEAKGLKKITIYDKTENNLFDDFLEEFFLKADEKKHYFLYNDEICIIMEDKNVLDFKINPESTKMVAIDDIKNKLTGQD